MTILKKGDVITILEGNPAEFAIVNAPAPLSAPFTHVSGMPVKATAVDYVVIDDDRVSLSNTNYVTDVNGQIVKNMVGGRPRNIVRK